MTFLLHITTTNWNMKACEKVYLYPWPRPRSDFENLKHWLIFWSIDDTTFIFGVHYPYGKNFQIDKDTLDDFMGLLQRYAFKDNSMYKINRHKKKTNYCFGNNSRFIPQRPLSMLQVFGWYVAQLSPKKLGTCAKCNVDGCIIWLLNGCGCPNTL